MTEDQLFLIRFNFQNMMRQTVGMEDAQRIGSILGIPPEEVKTALDSFEQCNRKSAEVALHGRPVGDYKEKRARIVFVGDSITSDRMSYMHILKKIFATNGGIEILDASVSGWHSGDPLQELYGSVIQKEPDIAVYALGTNDMRRIGGKFNVTSKTEYKRNVDLLLGTLHKSVRIVSTLPPVHPERIRAAYGELGWSFYEKDRQAYNRILLRTARRRGALVNDTREAFAAAVRAEVDVFHQDGLHLSPEGQSIIANGLFDILINVLKRS